MGALAWLGSTSPAEAEPAARPQEKMHLQAAVDFSPLADKLSELSDLIKASVLILQKQLEGLEGPGRTNADLLKEIGEKLVRIETALAKLEREMRRPAGYEYKILRTASERQANELGAEGWEMVASTREDWLLFRRPMFKGSPSSPRADAEKVKAENKGGKEDE
ncbi:MAG: hypothetical protein HYU36_01135 [Planctomycetes bacterium]|nr:hypothetical protein [Planctomycetota bacterium]